MEWHRVCCRNAGRVKFHQPFGLWSEREVRSKPKGCDIEKDHFKIKNVFMCAHQRDMTNNVCLLTRTHN